MRSGPADGHVDDAAFVRAPVWLVYRRLTNLAAWPAWWPGCRVRRLPPPADDPAAERFALELAAGPLRRLRLAVRPHQWRHDLGFSLALHGDLDGSAELWLEDTHGGTLVHHLARLWVPRARAAPTVAAYRRAFRRGLWGCKDALQLEARTSAGLTP